MAAQLQVSRFPVARKLPHAMCSSYRCLVRVGNDNVYLASHGRSIELRKLSTGEKIADIGSEPDLSRVICDMTWVGNNYVAYYACSNTNGLDRWGGTMSSDADTAITLMCVSTQTRVKNVDMSHRSLTPCSSLTAIDHQHILFQSCDTQPPVFAVVCNVFTGEHIQRIEMPQAQIHDSIYIWSRPLVVVQNKFVLGLRTANFNPVGMYGDPCFERRVAFDVHNLCVEEGTADTMRTLQIANYQHRDIADVAPVRSLPRVVVSTQKHNVIICIETGCELLYIFHHCNTLPLRTTSLSCNRFVQCVWDTQAECHRVSVVTITAHTCQTHLIEHVNAGLTVQVLERASNHHFVAFTDCAHFSNIAVFSACNKRAHIAAFTLCRILRRCVEDPTFAVCRRLLIARTDESAARENEQRRIQRAETSKRMRMLNN